MILIYVCLLLSDIEPLFVCLRAICASLRNVYSSCFGPFYSQVACLLLLLNCRSFTYFSYQPCIRYMICAIFSYSIDGHCTLLIVSWMLRGFTFCPSLIYFLNFAVCALKAACKVSLPNPMS